MLLLTRQLCAAHQGENSWQHVGRTVVQCFSVINTTHELHDTNSLWPYHDINLDIVSFNNLIDKLRVSTMYINPKNMHKSCIVYYFQAWHYDLFTVPSVKATQIPCL